MESQEDKLKRLGYISFEELKTKRYGEVGTPKRDKRDIEVLKEIAQDFGKRIFGSRESYKRWLNNNVISLGDIKPKTLLNSKEGIEKIIYVLNCIAYGDIA